MNWQELETFLTLAEELHFGRTAERLHLSRARVSQMTQTLERRVGGRLFERTSRQVALTALGRRLHEDLVPHHQGIVQAVQRASEIARGSGGVLTVGFSSPMAGERVMAVVEAFRAVEPRCEVRIREVHLSDRYSALRSGDLDVQLVELPVAEPDLTVGPVLLRDSRVLAVSADHPLAARRTVCLEDLVGETVLYVDGLPGYFTDWLVPDRAPSGRPIRRTPTTLYWQELLTLVAAGRGVTIAAAQGARYYPRPRLVYVPVEDAAPVDYGLLWRSSDPDPRIPAFARTAREVLAREAAAGEPAGGSAQVTVR